MNLYQHPKGYRYTSDTMFLYDFARSFRPRGSVLDVGCGCGILGLLLKRDFPSINLTQIDIQSSHIELTRKNSAENALPSRAVLGNFADFEFDEKFDFIVSNPPFYHRGTKKSEDESLILSRYADALPLESFLDASSRVLKSDGELIFCYDAKQIDEILVLCKKSDFKANDIAFVYPKAQKEATLALLRAKKSSKSLLKIHAPIFVFDGENYSELAKEIFARAQTRSIDWQF